MDWVPALAGMRHFQDLHEQQRWIDKLADQRTVYSWVGSGLITSDPVPSNPSQYQWDLVNPIYSPTTALDMGNWSFMPVSLTGAADYDENSPLRKALASAWTTPRHWNTTPSRRRSTPTPSPRSGVSVGTWMDIPIYELWEESPGVARWRSLRQHGPRHAIGLGGSRRPALWPERGAAKQDPRHRGGRSGDSRQSDGTE